MSDEIELLKRVYDWFNARDMESVLAAMHADVMWANGMEGGHVHGTGEVREYWTRQWAMIAAGFGAAPAFSTTIAFTASPQRSSGTPITAASATSGCEKSAFSTSAG